MIYTKPAGGWAGTISPAATVAIDPCDQQEANSPVAVTDGGRTVLAAGGCDNAGDGGGFSPGWSTLREPPTGWSSPTPVDSGPGVARSGDRIGILVSGALLYTTTEQGVYGANDVEAFNLGHGRPAQAVLAMPRLPGHAPGLSSIAATQKASTVAQEAPGAGLATRCQTTCALTGKIGIFRAPTNKTSKLRPIATHRLKLTFPPDHHRDRQHLPDQRSNPPQPDRCLQDHDALSPDWLPPPIGRSPPFTTPGHLRRAADQIARDRGFCSHERAVVSWDGDQALETAASDGQQQCVEHVGVLLLSRAEESSVRQPASCSSHLNPPSTCCRASRQRIVA